MGSQVGLGALGASDFKSSDRKPLRMELKALGRRITMVMDRMLTDSNS